MTDSRAAFKHVLEPAGFFLRYAEESRELIELSVRGTTLLVRQPTLTKALLDLSEYRAGEPDPERQAILDTAQRLADLATREIDRDFPLLHAHAIVGIWGALESWIDEMCCRWITLFPEHCDWGERRVKVSAADFLESAPNQRARLLLAAVKADRKVEEKLGVGQFESILGSLGLGGSVPTTISRSLLGMQQVRHIYAHRAGNADEAFIERCGELLDCTLGERVIVDSEAISNYVGAAIQYTHILHLRVEDVIFDSAEWPPELKG